jgi:hypothetical protein
MHAMVVLALLVSAGMVRGDVGPSFLKPDESFPAMRFDNLADYPDFDFYLLYFHGPGNPFASPHVTRVQSGEAIHHFEGSGRNGGAYLLAVPRGKPLPPMDRETETLDKKPTGYLRSARLDGTFAGSGYLIPYRIKIAEDNLEVAMQPSEWQPGAWSLSWLKALPCVLVPIVFCVVLGWLGARVARRLFPAKPAT